MNLSIWEIHASHQRLFMECVWLRIVLSPTYLEVLVLRLLIKHKWGQIFASKSILLVLVAFSHWKNGLTN